MKAKKKIWHKLKEDQSGGEQKSVSPTAPAKPPAQTHSPGGSRQGNAGMESETDGAHR